MILGALALPRVERIVERLLRWRDGHLAITVEGSALVVVARGTRR